MLGPLFFPRAIIDDANNYIYDTTYVELEVPVYIYDTTFVDVVEYVYLTDTIIEYIETWYYEDIRGECNESEIMVKLRSTDVVTVQLAIIRATDYSDVYQLN